MPRKRSTPSWPLRFSWKKPVPRKRSCSSLNAPTYSFKTATFFPAGGYGIPPEKQDEAKKSIEPIVQRIIKFFGDHPRQRFVAVIVCYGFSDETPIAKESPLYSPLLAKMKTNNPTRQELNVKLSELRAKSIANLLVDLIKINEGLIPNPKLINY